MDDIKEYALNFSESNKIICVCECLGGGWVLASNMDSVVSQRCEGPPHAGMAILQAEELEGSYPPLRGRRRDLWARM